jgi:HEPN domain-containing protein
MKKITELWLNVAFDDLVAAKQLPEIAISDTATLIYLNSLYTDSRYPGDTGLLPEGKPTSDEALFFVTFAEEVYSQIKMHLETKFTI